MNGSIPTGCLRKLQHLFQRVVQAPRIVWVLLAIGFALRVTWVLTWPNEQIIGDYLWLRACAKNLAAGHGYVLDNGQPTAFWPIGFPFTLSVLYRVFGPHDLAGKLANVLYSMGILAGTYALGRRWFSETAARLAVALLVFSPNQIAYNSLLGTDTLFTAIFLAALVVAFSPTANRTSGVLLGALLGAASYVKPVTLGLFPVLFVFLWAVRRDWRSAALQTGVAVGITVLLLSPWIVRNRIAFGKWLLTNEAGIVLLVGANPEATGQYFRARIVDEVLPKMQTGGEAEYHWNREAQRLALQYIREHPRQWCLVSLKKLVHMWKHDADGIRHTLIGVTPQVSDTLWNVLSRAGHLYYALLLSLVLGHVVLTVLRGQLLTIPNLGWLLVLYFSVVCFAFHGLPRYHYPLIPILCLYAGRFAERLVVEEFRVRSSGRPDRQETI